jgi:hypothetical protein
MCDVWKTALIGYEQDNNNENQFIDGMYLF